MKNLEMIPDEHKRRHLGNVLEGWAQLTAFSLEVVPVLARERQVSYNGVRYQVIAPRSHTPAKIARRIILGLPNALSKMLMWHVGTEKLELQLISMPSSDDGEPSAISFYRTSLICDLRLENWLQHLDRGFRGLSKSRYLREAYLEKASKLYYLGAHKANAEKRLKRTCLSMKVRSPMPCSCSCLSPTRSQRRRRELHGADSDMAQRLETAMAHTLRLGSLAELHG